MDVLILSRLQFALTAAFHFIFPALTIGMAWLNVVFLWRYWRSGLEADQKLARFWINLFVLTFVMGVASGMVMVFQFGTNWGDYARYVGDIFGAPLAAEAIFAFFLEGTFIGVLIWGHKRVSRGFYWFSSLMVAFGATLSAFWIIAANSWQQTPAGYALNSSGLPELTNFMAALFNPSTMQRYLHTVDACIIAGSLFIVGISAWFLLRKPEYRDFALKSMKLSVSVFLIASLVQFGFGHAHGVQVAETQPAKMAAFEALYETTSGAPMLLFGIPDEENQKVNLAIGLPKMLSLLMAGDANATIQGLDAFPREEWPPVSLSFYPYHLMLILGGYFVVLALVLFFLSWRRKLLQYPLFLKIVLYSIPLGVLATEVGWMCAEVGRQPWVVYGLLKTANAASYNVPAGQVLFSIILLCGLFALLFIAYLFLVRKKMHQGPGAVESHSAAPGEGVSSS